MAIKTNKVKIAIIDDSQTPNNDLVSCLLEPFACTIYYSPEGALLGFDENVPDIILMNIEIKDVDSFDLVKNIRAYDKVKDLPLVFFAPVQEFEFDTAAVDIEFESLAFDLGAVDYLKPHYIESILVKRINMHIKNARQKKELALLQEKNIDHIKELEVKRKEVEANIELQKTVVYTLADVVEMRDNPAGGHVARTQGYFKVIVDYLNENKIYQQELAGYDSRMLAEASQLHDIGKIAIPEHILIKPSGLSAAEFDIVKTHTTIGHEIITKAIDTLSFKADFLEVAAIITLSHHERWDGSGYPYGLIGEAIPLLGRIMSVVDAYDAIISVRHYKSTMTHEEAMQIIRQDIGTHFDPIIVEAATNIGFVFKSVNRKVENTQKK